MTPARHGRTPTKRSPGDGGGGSDASVKLRRRRRSSWKRNVFTFMSKYDLQEKIGEGSHGLTKVYSAVNRENGEPVAVKVMRKKGSSDHIRAEGRLHGSLGKTCPYVVPVLDFIEEDQFFYLCMPLAESDLFETITAKLKETGTPFAEADAKAMLLELLLALKYLHANHVAHRDIKPENVLLFESPDGGRPRCVLCDFGSAKRWSRSKKHAEFSVGPSPQEQAPGTYGYCSPEVLLSSQEDTFDERMDIWSLGATLFVILGGYSPFPDDDPHRMLQMAAHGDLDFDSEEHEPFWRDVSPQAKRLILRMLEPAPRRRITIEEALEDEWLLTNNDGIVGAVDVVAEEAEHRRALDAEHRELLPPRKEDGPATPRGQGPHHEGLHLKKQKELDARYMPDPEPCCALS